MSDANVGSGAFGVGFIGLGQIGAPMARHLIGWEGGLTVLDVRAEACEPFAAGGAAVAATPAEVAARSEFISLMVLDDAQVRDVLTGDEGLLGTARPGTVVAVHSTIAADAGVEILDAPVSGGVIGAHAGTLAVMVGGTAAAVERSRPVLERWAGLVAHLGPVGSGTRAKLARNLLQFTALTAVGEAQRLAEAAGIDPAALGEVVRHSDAVAGGPGAIMLRSSAGVMADDDPLRPFFEHTRALGEKDLDHALALADELGLDLPLARLARSRLAAALGLSHDEEER